MRSPNSRSETGEISTERVTRSRSAAPRLNNGLWRTAALAGAIAAAACGGNSRNEIDEGGERGRPDAGATARPDSGTVEPSRDAGGTVFVDAGEDAGAEVDAGSSATTDAGSDAGQTVPTGPDSDGDGIVDSEDYCPYSYDVKGEDGRALDSDGDGISNACDNSILTPNPDQMDTDGDGVGDVSDNAPTVYNPGQGDADLDGVADVVDNSPLPNPEQTDVDGDGYGAGWDCNDNADDGESINPGVSAEAEGACSPVDRNCDGAGGVVRQNPDGSAVFAGEPECTCIPGQVRPVGRTVGACVAGEETCLVVGDGSGFVITTPPQGNPNTPEACDGVDNDCDGTVDEGCGCTPPGLTRDCGPTAVGECHPGTQTCIGGTFGPCENSVEPQEQDLCNGKDEDCDGETDNGRYGGAGGTPGQTKRGRGACGLDDSATTGADEGLGRVECDGPNATRVSVNPGGSADRSLSNDPCNGKDDDCDGRIDEEEDYTGDGKKGEACNEPGACGEGVTVCAGDWATKCSSLDNRGALNPANTESSAGLCDEIDNDCDGVVDDGCSCRPGETKTCGTDVGVCKQGVITCDANRHFTGACEGPDFVGPATEVCNGLDDDCDGITDEFANGRAGQTCRGRTLSECDVAGVLECDTDNGGLRCSVSPGGSASKAVPETCNGVDDDCDGAVDNGLGVGTDCPAVGTCAAGKMQCAADGTVVCSTGPDGSASQATVEMCNQRDDDCDGSTDEGCRTCVPGATQECGTDEGECTKGDQTCGADGKWGADCVGGVRPAAADLCNGLDDDCDGATDETFTNKGLPCDGIGACGVGVNECKADGSGTICSTNPGASSDGALNERCNDADDDCNGKVDDKIPFSDAPATLGTVGEACLRPGVCGEGVTVCDGTLRVKCDSIALKVTEICNDGLDDDCDGQTDEGFQVGTSPIGGPCTLPGPCGAGVVRCKNASSAECSSIDNATAEVAANLIDDDCDGSTDE